MAKKIEAPVVEIVNNTDYFLRRLDRINNKYWLPGRGNLNTKLMIVVSHPNKNDLEARQLLTNGDAGNEFRNALNSVNIPEEGCWITSMVKYGLGNKDKPTSTQIEECAPYLDAEIERIKPD